MLNTAMSKANASSQHSRAFYKPVAVDERAREYLDTIGAPRTRDTVENAIRAFYSFRRWHSPTPLAWRDMDFDVLVKFDQWLRRHNYNDFSRQTYLSCVTEFLRYAIDKGWLKENFPMERATYRKRKARERFSYPIPEPSPKLPLLIRYYDELPLPDGDDFKTRWTRLGILRARAIVHTLYASAGRVSEVAALTRKQIQDGRLREVLVKGKGKKQRFIFLTPEALEAIRVYLDARGDDYEPLFIRHNKGYGQPLTRSMLWKIVAQAADAVGIKAHPHDFRHFRARQMLEQGAPLEAIQEILGHKDIGTTRRVYAHYSKPSIRAIFDRTTISAREAMPHE